MTRRERENIVQVLAREYGMVEKTFKDDEGDNSPKYVLLPSGRKANRVFFTGTVTETGETQSGMKARVNDGSGNFIMYPSDEYNPESADTLRDIEAPERVAVMGKVGVYEPEEGTVIPNVSPEFIKVVGKQTRTKGITEAARRTLDALEDPPEKDRLDEFYGGSQADEVREAVINALESVKS